MLKKRKGEIRMEKEKIKKRGLIVAFVIASLIAIVGMGGTFYYYSKTLKNNIKCVSGSENSSTNNILEEQMTFENYTKLLTNNNIEEYYSISGFTSSIVNGVFFENGNVYFLLQFPSGLNDEVKQQYENFKNSKKNELINKNNSINLYYKLPIDGIVLLDVKKIGQDDSSIILMETKDGKVYSYIPNYSYFNSNNELNIKEENNLKNIIKFGNYVHNEEGDKVFGININGNIIYQ